MGTNQVDRTNIAKKPNKQGHWNKGLLVSLNDPDLKVYEDELVIAIKDLYPKATVHYLVCPKADISELKCVKPVHLPLIKHMENVGNQLAEKHEGKDFLIGFHAIPSMMRLHLHVISDDFDSKCLKTKHHWNSFNTAYFLHIEIFINNLESGNLQHLSVEEGKKLLNTKLKCHKCEYLPKTMPDLKRHIKIHFQKDQSYS